MTCQECDIDSYSTAYVADATEGLQLTALASRAATNNAQSNNKRTSRTDAEVLELRL